MADRTYNILFVCTGNSARSVMAECILRDLAGDRFRVFSAGSQPTGKINGHALELLEKSGHDVADLRSKSWEEFAGDNAVALDFVITVCDAAAGEVCPVWPGQPMSAHWPFEDPAAFEGGLAETRAVFARVYRQIRRRLEIFAQLPITSLDRLSLKREMDAIGANQSEPAG